MRNKKGLTLIELLAVIAIIAILFILLIPQVTKATDKARVSGVQVDLHSYEVGMRNYFMEHFGEAKTVEKLNTYLDNGLRFEKINNKWVSKVEENAFGVKYELTSDLQSYMQVNSYTNEKDPRIHAVRVYEEGNEVKSMYIGFDEEKKKSEVDTTPPIIIVTPNGGEDVENVYIEVKDDKTVFSIQYAWSTDPNYTTEQWQSIQGNVDLSTVFLGRGTYYLHVKAKDLDMNTTEFSSYPYILGDSELPMIIVSENGSTQEKVVHTVAVSATDNKGVEKIEYAWTDDNGQLVTPWTETNMGASVSTPTYSGNLHLQVRVADTSGNVAYFTSNSFATGDREKPTVTLSPRGNEVWKDSHTTVVQATDNDELSSLKYLWSKKKTDRPTSGWTEITSGTTVKTPTLNGALYLHVQATDRSGNTTYYVSDEFNTGDGDFPVVTLTPNGNEKPAITYTTQLKVTDNKGVTKVEYVWSTSETTPTDGWATTAASKSLTSPQMGETLYLYIRAEDTYGNVTNFKSNPFMQVPFTYTNITINGVEGVSIQEYKGTKTDVVIPETLAGKPVIRIYDSAFSAKTLTSVVIPDTVVEIGSGAFMTTGLESVKLSKNLLKIDDNAFSGNKLTQIELPDSITYIGTRAFRNNQLTSVKIPKGVTAIVDYSFMMNKIKTIEFHDQVKSIGSSAFNTNELESLKIPSSVTGVGASAFASNPNIQTVQNCSNVNMQYHAPNAVVTSDGC